MAGTCRERARTCTSQVNSLLVLTHPATPQAAAISPTIMLTVLALLIVCPFCWPRYSAVTTLWSPGRIADVCEACVTRG